MDKDEHWNLILRVGGGIGGGTCSIGLLFVGYHNILDLIIRVVGLLCMAVLTGIATTMGADFYKTKIKPKLFKQKDKDDDQQMAA